MQAQVKGTEEKEQRKAQLAAELSTKRCTVALPTGKGYIMVELSNCWENGSSCHPQDVRTVKASIQAHSIYLHTCEISKGRDR